LNSNINKDKNKVNDYIKEDFNKEEEIMIANNEETIALIEDKEYQLNNGMGRGDDYNWKDDVKFIKAATYKQRKAHTKAKGYNNIDKDILDKKDFTYVKNFLLKLSNSTF